MFSSVTSWLGVGQRPKEGDDNKENEGHVHSDSKDSISSTSVETSISSKEGITETESDDNEGKASSTSESSHDASPLETLEDVSTKALNTAKEFGNILFSFGKAATKTVADTASKIKHTVEEKTILGDFTREQDKFVEEKKEKVKQQEAALAPWVGYGDEEVLKTEILALSQDKRNFVRNPPAGVQFQFDFSSSYPVALATLQEDPNLRKMRFDLVPKQVNEETFWRNYFYRVSLIRQSSQLTSSLAQQSESSPVVTKTNEHTEEDALESPPAQDEFVSDAFGEHNISEEDIRKEMEQQLRISPSGAKADDQAVDEGWKKDLEEKLLEQRGEEWEKELQQELQDYELVGGENDVNDIGDDELEKEILQQLEEEAGSLS
ncbi:synapse-associated protein 1-like isoform X3 [Biomphalaria glabrata]|uniref:Synapse-associated protein 1-like isoform X3 n=1 Tax=Biomphalaria glabrata TaxID=6526 RepID=A0A2C9KCV2_BIOGL|nr:synapse-associated protein 1-like isoform X3 [Biomphalaria glabrata]